MLRHIHIISLVWYSSCITGRAFLPEIKCLGLLHEDEWGRVLGPPRLAQGLGNHLQQKIYLSFYLSIHLSICLSMYSSICLYIYIFTYPSIYLFIKLHLYIYSSIYIYISICLHTCAAVDALAAWRMVWATPGLTLNTHTRKVDDSSCNKFQKSFWALDLRGFSLGGGAVSVTSH